MDFGGGIVNGGIILTGWLSLFDFNNHKFQCDEIIFNQLIKGGRCHAIENKWDPIP